MVKVEGGNHDGDDSGAAIKWRIVEAYDREVVMVEARRRHINGKAVAKISLYSSDFQNFSPTSSNPTRAHLEP